METRFDANIKDLKVQISDLKRELAVKSTK